MILYHGSNQQVITPDLLRSRPGKDFGQAFYLSEDRHQAEEMADFKVKTFGGQIEVSTFQFDETLLKDGRLKFLKFESYTREWADFILANRSLKEGGSIDDFDIVYGPIANDRIGRQILNLQAGYIDFDMFLKKIQYPEGITFQWAFCTEKALQILRRI